MIISALNGLVFGIGAMVGVALCCGAVNLITYKGRVEARDRDEKAFEHWKKLDEHWGRIADYMMIISKKQSETGVSQ